MIHICHFSTVNLCTHKYIHIYGKTMGHFDLATTTTLAQIKRAKGKNSVGIIFKIFMQIHVIYRRRLRERESDRVQSVCVYKPTSASFSVSFAFGL